MTETTDMAVAEKSAQDLLNKINAQDNSTNQHMNEQTIEQTITAKLEIECCGVWQSVGTGTGTIKDGQLSITFPNHGYRITGEVK